MTLALFPALRVHWLLAHPALPAIPIEQSNVGPVVELVQGDRRLPRGHAAPDSFSLALHGVDPRLPKPG